MAKFLENSDVWQYLAISAPSGNQCCHSDMKTPEITLNKLQKIIKSIQNIFLSQNQTWKARYRYLHIKVKMICIICMGTIWWGTRGTCPPNFSSRGDIIWHVLSTFFSLNFVFGKVSKIKMFVMFRVLFMLDDRPHTVKLMLKQSLVSLILLVY